MGQKVNPIGFRLGYVERFKSNWMASKKDFVSNIIQDEKIRSYIAARLADSGVADSTIDRTTSQVILTINTSKPGYMIGKGGAEVDKIKQELIALTKKNVIINVGEVKRPEISAKLIAEGIGQQIRKRISYHKAIKQALSSCMRSGVKGVKIRISGRLEGAEMARSEEFKEGSVPLHTLRAKIDYIAHPVNTIYGIIGVKVWVYTGQVYDKQEIYSGPSGKEKKAK
jgi:small subunit ribosomal protein S3